MRAPIAWSFSGMDPSGYSGLMVDVQAMRSLGVRIMSSITALTAQNSVSFSHIFPTSSSHFLAQASSLRKEGKPKAIKVGMLATREIVEAVSRFIKSSDAPVIVDPVLRSSLGKELLSREALESFRNGIIPQSFLLAPNIPEAEALTGISISSRDRYVVAAKELLKMGAHAVLIKGGHDKGFFCCDYYACRNTSFWLYKPRLQKEVRGTGCCLSSSIAASYAWLGDLEEAIVMGVAYTQRGIRLSSSFLYFDSWPVAACDMPKLSKNFSFLDFKSERLRMPSSFFYPIAPNFSWLKRLVGAGARSVQLRVKNKALENVKEEVKKALAFSKKNFFYLFVNDYWKIAVKYSAYGIHLGQGDLETVDWESVRSSKIRFGISTHSYVELAHALSYSPSYIALGPIFPTTAKIMPFSPQGLLRISIWKSLISVPLVAIGGINLKRAEAVLKAGAQGVSCIKDIIKDPFPERRTKEWLNLLEGRKNVRKE